MGIFDIKNNLVDRINIVFLMTVLLLCIAFDVWADEATVDNQVQNEITSSNEIDSLSPTHARKEVKIDIWEYQVKGNTLLDTKAIELVLYPYLGSARLISTIEQAADSLEQAYKNAGYGAVYVDIPEQDITDGRIVLTVVEARLSRLVVSGSRYHSIERIKSFLPSLEQGQAIHLPSLRHDINTLNRQSSNIRITPVLKPGKHPGTMEADLRVSDKLPVAIGLDIHNFNSLNTTRSRLGFNLGYENLWLKNHSASLQWQTSPEDSSEVMVLAGTYIFPVFGDSRVAVYGVKSESDVSAVADVAVVGNGNIAGVRLVHPLVSARHFLHTLSLGFDFKDFNQSVVLLGSDDVTTPIQYSSFVGIYNATILRPKSSSKLGVSLAMGLRGLIDDDAEQEFSDKRFGASPSYKHLQLSFKRQDRLPHSWRLNSRVKLQVSDTPLISNEQFSVGGSKSVRGYFESQSLMDNGGVASLELETPGLFKKLSKIKSLKAHVFGDIGSGSLKNPLPGQEDNFDLSSFGLGFRLRAGSVFSFDASAGYPLKAATEIDKGQWRFGLQCLANW